MVALKINDQIDVATDRVPPLHPGQVGQRPGGRDKLFVVRDVGQQKKTLTHRITQWLLEYLMSEIAVNKLGLGNLSQITLKKTGPVWPFDLFRVFQEYGIGVILSTVRGQKGFSLVICTLLYYIELMERQEKWLGRWM